MSRGFVPPRMPSTPAAPPPGPQEPYRPRRRRRSHLTGILATASVLAALGTAGYVAYLQWTAQKTPIPLTTTTAPTPVGGATAPPPPPPTTAASASDAPPTTPATKPVEIDVKLTTEIGRTCGAMAAAVAAKDAAGLAALFDGATLFDNLRESGLTANLTPAARTQAGRAYATDVVGLMATSKFFPFTKLTVVKIQPLPGAGRVRVSTRARVGSRDVKYFWWLKRSEDDGRWRVYDFETPGATHRWFLMATTNDAVKKPSVSPATARWILYVDTLVTMRDNLTRGVADGVPKLNALLVEQRIAFPPVFEAARMLVRAEGELLANRPVEALSFLSQAEGLPLDQPRIALVRSRVYLSMGNWRKAIEAASAYVDDVGEDAQGYAVMGKAHEAAGERPQALVSYQAGLADDPGDADCAAGVRRVR